MIHNDFFEMNIFSKSYWIFLLMSACAGILIYLVATALWYCIAHVNWFQFPDIFLACVAPCILGSMIVALFIKIEKSSAFITLYLAFAIIFAVITLAFNDMYDTSMRAWGFIFIIGWCFISILPVYFLLWIARRLFGKP